MKGVSEATHDHGRRVKVPTLFKRRVVSVLTSGLLVGPTAVLLVVMVMVPLFILLWYSFAPEAPNQLTMLSLDSYAQLFTNDLYFALLAKTLITAGLAAFLTAVVSWPAAWTLARLSPQRRNPLLALIIVPYLTSYLLLIYSLFVVLGSESPVMTVLQLLGLVGPDASILYTQVATVLILIYENLPIMLFVLYSGSESIEANLLAAASSLGASPWSRFRHIVLPLSVPSLAAGFVLVFVPMTGVFVEPQILGGPNGTLLGVIIADQLTTVNNPSFGSTLSILLLVAILTVLVLLRVVRTVAQRLLREGS